MPHRGQLLHHLPAQFAEEEKDHLGEVGAEKRQERQKHGPKSRGSAEILGESRQDLLPHIIGHRACMHGLTQRMSDLGDVAVVVVAAVAGLLAALLPPAREHISWRACGPSVELFASPWVMGTGRKSGPSGRPGRPGRSGKRKPGSRQNNQERTTRIRTGSVISGNVAISGFAFPLRSGRVLFDFGNDNNCTVLPIKTEPGEPHVSVAIPAPVSPPHKARLKAAAQKAQEEAQQAELDDLDVKTAAKIAELEAMNQELARARSRLGELGLDSRRRIARV